jgi:hypothetical protein
VDTINSFLSENWKTLFDGVLGLAVVGILGFLLPKIWRRLFAKRAQSALVPPQTAGPLAPAASAVDGGTVNQTVNYFPPTALALPPVVKVETERKSSQPRPNIQFYRTRVAKIAPDDKNVVREDPTAEAQAVLLNVTNDAVRNVLNSSADVKATLIFSNAADPDNPKYLARATGAWIDRYGDSMNFEIDASHDLVLLGFAHGECGSFNVRWNKVRIGSAYELQGFDLPASGTLRVKVRLIDDDSGEVFCEREYDINLPSLEVSYRADQ